ncbi:MAG TPA: DUF885 family protein [Syntrophales bacterium]|nr:DUF885 family protein [Syntrophales bacterium]
MKEEPLSSVETICREMFEFLAYTFPVACASDEFFYFPQFRPAEARWDVWDRFSEETVGECARRLTAWETELERVISHHSDPDARIDGVLCLRLSQTLREQLTEVRVWETQPTFYLTLACVGLAEAMEEHDPAAGHERAGSLSAFLDRSGRNLSGVPLLFRDIGLEMVSDTRNYLLSLMGQLPELETSLPALERFKEMLLSATTREDFLLPHDLLERIYSSHMACDVGLEEIREILDREICQTKETLDWEAGCLFADWSEVLRGIPMPTLGKEGIIGLYRGEVEKLAQHCLDRGWLSTELYAACPVTVAPMPAFLSAVRSASSYSISPVHPPVGGNFYVINAPAPQGEDLCEYPMLSAHETYPGHHLLDVSRWNLQKPWRRAVELPIFYEGWACFAEELMRLTGYFHGSADGLLLARRRLWRAVRGKVDIGLQTGMMDIPVAAAYLKETGIDERWAINAARQYSLNPGFQQCYTIGLKRLLYLFDTYGRDDTGWFVRTILSQGEIGFPNLEKVLKNISH